MPKIVTSKSNVAQAALETSSREELAATAKALGVPVGKSKANTIANLIKAGDAGKVHFKTQLTVSFKPEGGTRTTYLGRTLRNYISGPGKGNETWLVPAAAVTGSPAPAGE